MKNDNPQFTLHKLPEGFIVTSDEEVGWSYNKPTLNDNGKVGLPENRNSKKLIAQQDQIDFSSLSPEIQKEIRWFDWLRIAILSEDEEIEKIGQEYHSRSWYKGVEFGFQKALELLSDRRFTKDELINMFILGGKHKMQNPEKFMDKCNEIIESLSHKSWKVELEMETVKGEYIGRRKIGVTPSGEPTYINEGYEEIEVPKLTDGKIKITRLW